MNLSDDPGCAYCQTPYETMLLAFVNCPTVKDFLEGSEGWLQSIVDPHIKLGDNENILGWDSPENIISRAIVVTIQIIYQKRQLGKPYHLLDVERLLANQVMLEEYLANINNRETQFEKIWGSVYLDLSEV